MGGLKNRSTSHGKRGRHYSSSTEDREDMILEHESEPLVGDGGDVGYAITAIAPLVMVLMITMAKEGYDDFQRMKRDKLLNSEKITRITKNGPVTVSAAELEVGWIVKIDTNQRIPADMIVLKTSDESGSVFLRTDQLDGETDWKLRRAVGVTQRMSERQIAHAVGSVEVEAPKKEIYNFQGRVTVDIEKTEANAGEKTLSVSVVGGGEGAEGAGGAPVGPAMSSVSTRSSTVVEGVGLEQTMWTHTVLASGTIIGLVMFTGKETRSAMNQSQPRNKVGLFDLEVNSISKLLCAMLTIAAIAMTIGKGYSDIWYIYAVRFVLLLSHIVPISLRVNMDMAKMFYAKLIHNDSKIPNTLVRTSTIPEELGRIDYLLSDKTGTLTRNEMIFKKLHIGSEVFSANRIDQLVASLIESFNDIYHPNAPKVQPKAGATHNNNHAALPVTTAGVAPALTADSPSRKKKVLGKTSYDQLESGIVVGAMSPRLSGGRGDFKDGYAKVGGGDEDALRLLDEDEDEGKGGRKYRTKGRTVLSGGRRFEDEDHQGYRRYKNTSSEVDSSDSSEYGYNEDEEDSASTDLSYTEGDVEQGLLDGYRSASNTSSALYGAAGAVKRKSSIRAPKAGAGGGTVSYAQSRPNVLHELRQALLAIALCHNVSVVEDSHTGAESFQAASPDEVALVQLAKDVGLKLLERTERYVTLQLPGGHKSVFEILFCFPFSSETKRMGIIVREIIQPGQMYSVWDGKPINGVTNANQFDVPMLSKTHESSLVNESGVFDLTQHKKVEALANAGAGGELATTSNLPLASQGADQSGLPQAQASRILLLVKGAETVMIERLRTRGTQWLNEECDNLARDGLRTLVLGCRELGIRELADFAGRYNDAKASMRDRETKMRRCVEAIEAPLRLLGLTGVEDRLQDDVSNSIESMRHAGIKVWLLTGDKVETAICVAISAGLKARTHQLNVISCDAFPTETSRLQALERFSLAPEQTVLVLDGGALATFLLPDNVNLFTQAACRSPAVICCRCSPTQKAEVVRAIKEKTGKRTCAIGDGGNDVAMILAADVGVGIEGKEGKQASLAADFSITQFSHLTRLLLWHGRNSFNRSSTLVQFVIHRGLIISVIQVLFSCIFFFVPLSVFSSQLQMGYTTVFTTLPVFALVYDEELPVRTVLHYPELYETLKRGRQMGSKVFWCWMLQSVYQGSVIMILSLVLFNDNFMNIMSIAFSALVFSELLNVVTEVHNWHPRMVAAEVLSLVIYVAAVYLLPSCFDLQFVASTDFFVKVGVIVALSWGPPHLFKVIHRIIKPPQRAKLVL